jgi:hypothetical protein
MVGIRSRNKESKLLIESREEEEFSKVGIGGNKKGEVVILSEKSISDILLMGGSDMEASGGRGKPIIGKASEGGPGSPHCEHKEELDHICPECPRKHNHDEVERRVRETVRKRRVSERKQDSTNPQWLAFRCTERI